MQKLSHQLSGELGETLALSKFVSIGLHAYISPPGAPGHDIMVITPDGPKSVEVKTRQFIDRPSEISRWPVNMATKEGADFFLFVELNLRSLEPTFYLLNGDQAKATHKDYDGNGNCIPSKVRAASRANDFSKITKEPFETPTPTQRKQSKKQKAIPELRQAIKESIEFGNLKIVQYDCQSIDVFDGTQLQSNTIEKLRQIAKKIGISEYNGAGGLRNTRQLGDAVIRHLTKSE